ncbi:DUF2332 domain-containing protein [Paeniglutamicibacter sp. NPDC012692]|uniref:DUF2332 domain-containing protein n=1 Tax=Paeniglutamicibacter sp. NPDC012692 TaxID=3364388 RepID=UPI0036CF03DD
MSTQATEFTVSLYLDYARRWFHGHSPLYVQWATGVANDPDLLALVAELPEPKRQPNLVFAAARYLGSGDGDFEDVRDFMLARWPEVAGTVLSHRTQTNEAGRCATLLPVLSMIAAQERRPLALIEVGPSAGLCLLPDLYSYSFDGAPPLGSGSPLLHCRTTGNPPLPTALPDIAWRAGVDLNPLDGTDPETVAWLRSLVWPGQTERLKQLDEALETLSALKSGAYGSTAGAPTLMTGDLNDRIRELVEAAPEGSVPVVFHSAVLMYLDEADRKRFAATVSAMDCRWISNEIFFVDTAGRSHESADQNSFTLALDGVPLARTGQHGAELHWLETIFGT